MLISNGVPRASVCLRVRAWVYSLGLCAACLNALSPVHYPRPCSFRDLVPELGMIVGVTCPMLL